MPASNAAALRAGILTFAFSIFMTYKVTGIIIKRTNLGEADRIVSILTPDRGKIKAVARGVRKILSKMAGHLELFCLTDLVIAEGRNLDTITAAQAKKCFFALRSNLQSTFVAKYLAEITDKMTHENDKHPAIFELFEEVLDNLNGENPKILIPYFELNFLAELGYRPELQTCINCRKKISHQNNSFDFSGGLICEKCSSAKKISADSIKVLRLILAHQLSYLSKVKLSSRVLKEVEEICAQYITEISQLHFNARRFIK